VTLSLIIPAGDTLKKLQNFGSVFITARAPQEISFFSYQIEWNFFRIIIITTMIMMMTVGSSEKWNIDRAQCDQVPML
jgi:hypothetical protein